MMRIEEFLDALASGAPVPGGGGASALGGALGSALGQMVANLTVGKKGQLGRLQRRFLELAREDEEVFAPLAEAYRLPASTEEERAFKEQVMEKCLLDASLVPLEVMRAGLETLDILKVLEEKGSVMAVSDVGVGAQLARASVAGAAMNVRINTRSMKDRGKAEELNRKADEMLKRGMEQADAVYERILLRLS